jgi:NAD(P)-dependent dehydrogenase (short-subunit alcohol dehydrogenase family)
MAIRLITGCSSGFGEALALAFAARGDAVIASMRNMDAAPEAFRAWDNIECIELDVTVSESRRSAIAHVLGRHGRIDTLVNNAGIVAYASIEDTPDLLARRIFETNYFGPVALMQAVLPLMRSQGGGRIVNVTAIGAIISTPFLGIYCASKHALDSVASVVDIEGRPYGVRAPSVLPGQFRTPIMGKEPPIISEPYQRIAETLQAARTAHAADVLEDVSSVVEAVVAAATDPDPKIRYLAGIGQLTGAVKPAMAEMDRLHDFSARRSGVE